MSAFDPISAEHSVIHEKPVCSMSKVLARGERYGRGGPHGCGISGGWGEKCQTLVARAQPGWLEGLNRLKTRSDGGGWSRSTSNYQEKAGVPPLASGFALECYICQFQLAAIWRFCLWVTHRPQRHFGKQCRVNVFATLLKKIPHPVIGARPHYGSQMHCKFITSCQNIPFSSTFAR